jgi:hypothetical protein
MRDPLEHRIDLHLASGAQLTILSFSDRESRWLFSYTYRSQNDPGEVPDIVNEVKLTADYRDGLLAPAFVLAMHVVIPTRLGRRYFAGLDISPGAKTYLEFSYERTEVYRLVEICKGASERVRIDMSAPSIVRPIEFPFPVPDQLDMDYGRVNVPFRTNSGAFNHFTFPLSTLR